MKKIAFVLAAVLIVTGCTGLAQTPAGMVKEAVIRRQEFIDYTLPENQTKLQTQGKSEQTLMRHKDYRKFYRDYWQFAAVGLFAFKRTVLCFRGRQCAASRFDSAAAGKCAEGILDGAFDETFSDAGLFNGQFYLAEQGLSAESAVFAKKSDLGYLSD